MGVLTVKLEKIENLRDADLIGKSDPYVTFYLEQDNAIFDKGFGKKESSRKKNELSPVYNENFSWDLGENGSLDNMVLWIKVLDEDVGIDRKLGKTKVDLTEVAPTRDPQQLQLPLQEGAVLFLSIRYTEIEKGELTVLLERVEDLKDGDLIGKSDPYVKFHLEQDNKVFDKNFGKQESSVKKDELSPVYNETFVWQNVFSLKNMVLWIKVKDEDRGIDKTLATGRVDLENFGACFDPKARSVSLEGGKKTRMYLKISHQ